MYFLANMLSLIPAHAGVIPPVGFAAGVFYTYPRARGGDPA